MRQPRRCVCTGSMCVGRDASRWFGQPWKLGAEYDPDASVRRGCRLYNLRLFGSVAGRVFQQHRRYWPSQFGFLQRDVDGSNLFDAPGPEIVQRWMGCEHNRSGQDRRGGGLQHYSVTRTQRDLCGRPDLCGMGSWPALHPDLPSPRDSRNHVLQNLVSFVDGGSLFRAPEWDASGGYRDPVRRLLALPSVGDEWTSDGTTSSPSARSSSW